MSTSTKFENRLAKEKSPYLLQHKHNPVDWYPWGPEAFEKAKKENKPIFLSVGYSTCHWCHVMEKESFESQEIADILNKHFVPVKVDREERPDVDRIYMLFVQATSGGGGWPMSVWLTPDLKPFYAGTYFPPSGKYGRPGFSDILYRIDGIWKKQKEDVLENADDIMSQLENHVQNKSGAKSTSLETDFVSKVFDNYYMIIENSYDSKLGGFSSAPKFPRPVVFTALFQHYLRSKNPNTLRMCEFTLKQMFKGGMHDHLGGGFHRYSVDKYWHVPHFEKMLYDQAQLVSSYLTAYQISKKEIFAEAARDILDYVSTKLLSKEGGFYSAEDADSKVSHNSEEKAEGAFFVWTKDEIDSLLGNDSPLFCYHFGVEKAGNTPPNSDPHGEFRNKNVLIQRHDVEDTAKNFKLSVEEAKEKLKQCKQKLYEIREKRPHPFLDDKIITSWNGLMIAAFAEASQVLSDKKYLDIATNAAQFIESVLYKDEHLIRNFREHASNIKGFADDYAFMISALLNLYEAGGNIKWLEWALTLQEKMNDLFYDEKGGYFATEEVKGELLLRIKEDYDGAEPSANSYAVMNLLRLHYITQSQSYLDKAKNTIHYFRSVLEGRPIVCPHMVAALDWLDNEPRQIVVASNDLEDETTRQFRQTIFSKFINRIILYADEGKGQKYLLSLGVDYLKEGSMKTNNSVTAHVCHNMKCEMVNDVKALEKCLD